MKYVIIFAFLFLFSCTHWLTDSSVRIQMQNLTNETIGNLSIKASDGKLEVLVPETLEALNNGNNKSIVYESQWIGKFDFVIFMGENTQNSFNLGKHKLKAGSVVAQIIKENGNLKMILK